MWSAPSTITVVRSAHRRSSVSAPVRVPRRAGASRPVSRSPYSCNTGRRTAGGCRTTSSHRCWWHAHRLLQLHTESGALLFFAVQCGLDDIETGPWKPDGSRGEREDHALHLALLQKRRSAGGESRLKPEIDWGAIVVLDGHDQRMLVVCP